MTALSNAASKNAGTRLLVFLEHHVAIAFIRMTFNVEGPLAGEVRIFRLDVPSIAQDREMTRAGIKLEDK